MSEVSKEVARLLREAWAPPKELPETGIDQLLVRAYKTAVELKLHMRRLDRRYGPEIEIETQRLLDRSRGRGARRLGLGVRRARAR